MTTAQRARKRATESRLRAIYHKSRHSDAAWYQVWNLTKHVAYKVWWNATRGAWECTCPTNNAQQRCKHVQRVMDREEQRIRKEALAHGEPTTA